MHSRESHSHSCIVSSPSASAHVQGWPSGIPPPRKGLSGGKFPPDKPFLDPGIFFPRCEDEDDHSGKRIRCGGVLEMTGPYHGDRLSGEFESFPDITFLYADPIFTPLPISSSTYTRWISLLGSSFAKKCLIY